MKKPAKRQAYHHGDLRRALVRGALEALAAVGAESFTLRDLARRVGVAPSAPYRHFADKEAVLAAVAAECAEQLGAAMDAAVVSAGGDSLDRFRLSGIAYVRFAVTNPASFRVMNMPSIASRVPLSAGVNEWMETEVARLRAAQARGELVDLPIDQIMLTTRALMYGLARLIVDAQDGLGGIDADAAARLAEAVTNVLGMGLVPRAAAPERGSGAGQG